MVILLNRDTLAHHNRKTVRQGKEHGRPSEGSPVQAPSLSQPCSHL